MQIKHIYECPELMPIVANHLFDQWQELHKYEKESYLDILNDLKQNRYYDKIPITLVVVKDGEFLGTISIIDYDMVGREALTPWVADLYIVPKYRNTGVLFRLFDELRKEIIKLGIREIYFYTMHKGSYYKKLGFKDFEEVNYANQQVMIMKKIIE